MKDYRTWWRNGVDVKWLLYHPKGDMGNHVNLALSIEDIHDSETEDCMAEQLWAIREGLA